MTPGGKRGPWVSRVWIEPSRSNNRAVYRGSAYWTTGRDMFWDDLIRRWRRDTGGMSPRLLRAAAGHVAVLPAPKPRRRLRIPWLVLIALGIAALALLLQGGQVQAGLVAVSTPDASGLSIASSDRLSG